MKTKYLDAHSCVPDWIHTGTLDVFNHFSWERRKGMRILNYFKTISLGLRISVLHFSLLCDFKLYIYLQIWISQLYCNDIVDLLHYSFCIPLLNDLEGKDKALGPFWRGMGPVHYMSLSGHSDVKGETLALCCIQANSPISLYETKQTAWKIDDGIKVATKTLVGLQEWQSLSWLQGEAG